MHDKDSLVITREDHRSPDAAALLKALDEDLLSRYPADAIDAFDLEGQAAGDFHFFVVRLHGRPVGCGGWCPLDKDTAELKRMYVDPAHRGVGIARRLLHHIEADAAVKGVGLLRLESGSNQPEANRLYAALGYQPIEAFGSHVGNPWSRCFEKALEPVSSCGRFTRRAQSYKRFRPGYPEPVYQLLLDATRATENPVVADLGSGTGIFCGGLLRRGFRVIGVEPDDAMRRMAEEELAEIENFTSIKGTAEATFLPPDSVDAITATQSFHWFDAAACQVEFRRILRPGGTVALIWNEYDHANSPFIREYEFLLRRFSPTDIPALRRKTAEEKAQFFWGPGKHDHLTFSHHQVLDREGLHGRADSTSHVPLPEEPEWKPFHEKLDDLFDRHARRGRLVFPYQTIVYIGRPA